MVDLQAVAASLTAIEERRLLEMITMLIRFANQVRLQFLVRY